MPDGTITPFIFSADMGAFGIRIPILRYQMPVAAYQRLGEVAGKNGTPRLEGLDLILAWLAPETDRLRIDRPSHGSGKTLIIEVYTEALDTPALRERIEAAVTLWVSVVGKDAADEINNLLEDGRGNRRTWVKDGVSTRMNPTSGPPDPANGDLFDVLAVEATRLFTHNKTQEDDSISRWIAPGPRRFLPRSREIVRLHANLDPEHKPWAEVLRFFAFTTPEKPEIRIGVSAHIRNFTEVRYAPARRDTKRTLDVFIFSPHERSGAPIVGHWMPMHSAPLKNITDKDGSRRVIIDSKPAGESLRLVAKSVGAGGIVDDFMGGPIGRGPMHVLPRAGTVHGDKYLIAGTGLGMPDRERFHQELAAGFKGSFASPVGALTYNAKKKIPYEWSAPFQNVRMKAEDKKPASEESRSEIRDRVQAALSAYDDTNTMNLLVFWQRKALIGEVRDIAEWLFGPPDESTADTLIWRTGLRLSMVGVPADILAKPISVPSVDYPENLKPEQRRKLESAARKHSLIKAEKSMSTYLKDVTKGLDHPSIAVLEMPEDLNGDKRDPYAASKRAFASARIPLQVLLMKSGSAKTDVTAEKKSVEARQAKLVSSLLDLLRVYGVTPFAMASSQTMGNRRQPKLHAWWVIQSHNPSVLTPICVECADEKITVAMMSDEGTPVWVPYALAADWITLGSQNFANLHSKTKAEQTASIERFFAQCRETHVPDVVFCETTNIRRFVRSLSNRMMELGNLKLGAHGRTSPELTLADGAGTTLIRIGLNGDAQPSYVVEGLKQHIKQGLFTEGDAQRTFWLSRGLPKALQQSVAIRKANQKSRLNDDDKGRPLFSGDRKFPSLSEVVVVLNANQIPPDEWARFTRLCMKTHVTHTDELSLPFPLHEARILGAHVAL